jgi:hypothetical protein
MPVKYVDLEKCLNKVSCKRSIYALQTTKDVDVDLENVGQNCKFKCCINKL